MQIENLLDLSVRQHASDLHLLPGLPPLLRIDGDLVPVAHAPALSHEQTKQLIYSIITVDQQQSFEKNLVIDLAIHVEKIGNFRASIFHQLHGIAAVFRIVPMTVPTFETISLPPVLKRMLALPYGLVLVTGATGSGKSTTLAAMIEHINATQSKHIITIEDPIEFVYRHNKSAINQLQIGRDTPNASIALRASLRQDPDVILLGELRDLESIRLALTAAETGHLVLTTLHASSAPLAINRIVDVFPPEEKMRVRNLLAETIQAVICQMLVKKGEGGRIAAFEIMLATPAIRHLIRQDMMAHMETTIQTSGDIGMCTMDQYLQTLVAKGAISSAAARNIVANRESFRPN